MLREYANPGMYLHGAAQALFYDQCIGCMTIPLAKPGFWEDLGFTRNLNLNYLRTAKIGEFVLMETEVSNINAYDPAEILSRLTRSQVVQIGRSMGYMQGTMRRERDGAIISTCEQNKFSTNAGMPASKLVKTLAKL